MKKRLGFRCICGEMFATNADVVSHYRKAHPTEGIRCWDQIGTVGDDFADRVIEELRTELRESQRKNQLGQEAITKHDKLLTKFNALARVFDIAQRAAELYWQTYGGDSHASDSK